ncbi:hypothetical protein RI129_009350 [Pyrocoelia pectoralis]|uniref:Cytochrome P450 n=1 Tax=Pyrocoelia pectoralis TaxID=417401 RepID=A0AAN7V892_9COLE
MIIITIVAFLTALKLKNWFRAVCLAMRLPGPPAVPFFGNVLLLKNETEFLQFLIDAGKYEKTLMRGWVSLIPFVGIVNPKHLHTILASTKQTDKSFLYTFMHTFLGQGLLTNNGNKWKLHRKYIQPYFHKSVLTQFIKTFTESSDLLVEQLHNKQEVNITKYINNCVLNILHCALFGIPVRDHDAKLNSPFNKGHLIILERLKQPWYILDFAYKFSSFCKHESTQKSTLQQFAKEILDQRRQGLGKHEWCLLDSLIEISENYPRFNETSIVEEICTFMLAGQDSVGAAVAFTLYCLGKHPEVQQKVVEELDKVFKEHSEITMENLYDLVFLRQCIKESLRLYPSVPLISRKLAEDVNLGKYTLPAGLNIFISPISTHRLTDYYPNPHKFDPDRFSQENEKKIPPYAFIPFSAGPRNCIGYEFAYLEIEAIIAAVLRNFVIEVPQDYELKLSYRVTLRAKGGIPLYLKPR